VDAGRIAARRPICQRETTDGRSVLAVASDLQAAFASALRTKQLHFGNSFLENSIPWFQPTLARSAGCNLELKASLGAGWQIWMHVNSFNTSRVGVKKELIEGAWNAIVVQHFGSPGLSNVVDHMFEGAGRINFSPPKDVGDIASAGEIIDWFLCKHPERGRVFIYSSCPYMPAASEFRKRVQNETTRSLRAAGESRAATLKKVKERKLTLEEMEPLMRAFNYGAEWLAPYEQNQTTSWMSRHFHSRDYDTRLMEGLKAHYPKLWEQKRLALIPCGEVFYELDRKMRAGLVPGITNVGYFSRDGGHVRAGLPRYTLGATCIAVMFGVHPRLLDYSIYNTLDNYKTENLPVKGYVHQPDLGVLLEITPQRAKVVNDTVWAVVTNSPYTRVSQ
jgi:hypothetical protein